MQELGQVHSQRTCLPVDVWISVPTDAYKSGRMFTVQRGDTRQQWNTGYVPSVLSKLATGWTTGVRLPVGATQPPRQGVPEVLSPGVKRPGHENNHPPPPSRAEFKNA
jgi:hypothetical protein